MAVESPCCMQVFCSSCTLQWLDVSTTRHACSQPVLLSKFKQLHPFVSSCLGELFLTCDHAGDTELAGCTLTIALKNLHEHVRELPFRDGCEAPSRYLTLSSLVGALLNAPNELLQGDVGTKLLTKLIDARSSRVGWSSQPGAARLFGSGFLSAGSPPLMRQSTLRRRQSTLEGI